MLPSRSVSIVVFVGDPWLNEGLAHDALCSRRQKEMSRPRSVTRQRQHTESHHTDPRLPGTSRQGLSSSATSQTSTTSLSTAFVHLGQRQVAFFDRVIDLLPDDAQEFSELKRAYNRARSEDGSSLPRDLDADADAALWDSLLRLTHVRGRTWAQRWDAVRVALGLEPRIVSEDDESGRSTPDEETPRQAAGNRPHSWHAEVAKIARLRAPSSTTESPAAAAQQRRRDGRTEADEIEALRARMAALTAEASSLASSIERGPAQGATIARPSILVSARDRGKSSRGRKLRFASSSEQFEISKATTVESASDEEGHHVGSSHTSPPTNTKSNEHHRTAFTPAKRRFEEVVARSRSERDASRRAEEAQQEAAEEVQLASAYRQADLLFGAHLVRKCLSWWLTLHRKRTANYQHAVRARDELLKTKAFDAWSMHYRKEHRRISSAAKIDTVRCKLRAWRIWQRTYQEKRRRHREERRMELRGAFEVTRSKMEYRLTNDYYQHWRRALMERRASRFRAEHLLRGAISLWRIHTWRTSMLHESEERISSRQQSTLLSLAWRRWTIATQMREQSAIARSYDRQQTLQYCLNRWVENLAQKKSEQRRAALADRWRTRLTKAYAWQVWMEKAQRIVSLQAQADAFQIQQEEKQRAIYLRKWILCERRQLFVRISSSRRIALLFSKWHTKHSTMKEDLMEKEAVIHSKRNSKSRLETFKVWKEATRKIVLAQQLAAKRDGRKVLGEVMSLWKASNRRKELAWYQAQAVDAHAVQRRCYSIWIDRRRQNKLKECERRRNFECLRNSFAFWQANAAERRREAIAVAMMRSKVERRTRGEVLHKWTVRVIERKSLYMEAAEAHDGLLLQRAWQAWMAACIRHDDMLNLSNSFRDVKCEDWMRRLFTKWSNAARAERLRRERAERFLAQHRKQVMHRVIEQWYDRYMEATMREQELNALLQRQEAAKRSVLAHWKARTRCLPAVQLDHARLKSHAFYRWHELLPFARLRRTALEHDRLVMQAKAFDHWLYVAKAKRAFRAAARFGGPSAVRLRAAHRRSSANPGGSSGGGIFGGAGRTSRRRTGSPGLMEDSTSGNGRQASMTPRQRAKSAFTRLSSDEKRDADVSSLRESDLGLGSSPNKAKAARSMATSGGAAIARAANGRPAETSGTRLPALEGKRSTLASPPPALRRWMNGITYSGSLLPAEEDGASGMQPSSEIFSEPSRRARHDFLPRRVRQPPTNAGQEIEIGHGDAETGTRGTTRTPSPASRTQSEATIRVRYSPRKQRPVPSDELLNTLRARRRRIPEQED